MVVTALIALLLGSTMAALRPPGDDVRLRDFAARLELWYVAVQDQAVLGGQDLLVLQEDRRLSVWLSRAGSASVTRRFPAPLLPPAGSARSWRDREGRLCVSRFGSGVPAQAQLVYGETQLKVSGDELGRLS